ncbi:MAG: transporter substrate-binding domain-containing protein, partial [Clostridia bacterium]|nr:transporter substrate-binding domain-containing protein [Clostridia bacterium]
MSGSILRSARRALIPAALICLMLTLAVLPVSAGGLEGARTASGTASRAVTLRVGWFDQPGYMEMDDNGQPGGYLYEYLQSISQQTGWQYTYVRGTRSNLYRQLTIGEIDLMGLLFVDQYQSDRVLMSNLTAGVDQTTLFTTVESPLCENDYASFDGLRIAVSLNSSSSAALLNLAQGKGFTPHLVYFSGEEGIKNAVRKGVVDAGVIDSYRTQSEFRSLATFEPRNFYFGVTDTRPDIARKLNDAMAGILATNTTFNDQLSERYLHEVTDHFSITDEEKAFIAEHPTLIAAYGQSWV